MDRSRRPEGGPQPTLARGGACAILPDFAPRDIAGSPYAIAAYEVASSLGGDDGLARFRQQLARAGIGLVLDFVPNHTALDYPWVRRHPEWYVQGERERADALGDYPPLDTVRRHARALGP